MKEEQNHQEQSEQLGVLYETTNEITNQKAKELGEKKFFKSNEERFETLSKEHFPENILILDLSEDLLFSYLSNKSF